jgi:hypothetical protein
MTQLYRFYQKVGGEEAWSPIQANLSFDEIKPTFTTVLAVDTLMSKDTPKDVKAKAKYQGPLYFDFDAEDLGDSIAGAQKLVEKLTNYELRSEDILIYLSGKKGLHVLVPDVCFMQKPAPTMGLVAMYKEIAYKLAVDTMDFRVYTAGQGRQFRTCYNVRENGNYKVPLSMEELKSLTPENYDGYCKAPRVVNGHAPAWRGKFALLFDEAYQKISKQKPKAMKPVPKDVLKQQLPQFAKLASGEHETAGGFNVIAMQLALYAREMGWTEQQFTGLCQGVIQNHKSDGSRYNTPQRRDRELRRMFWYLEDNPGFEYSVQGLKACIAKPEVSDPAPWDGEDEAGEDTGNEKPSDFAGVYRGYSTYLASKGDDGDIPITNFIFRDVKILRSMEFNNIIAIEAKVRVHGGKVTTTTFSPHIFTGGSALQNAVASFGGSFSGTDVHARGVYQAMLREVTADEYVLESEGINLFRLAHDSSQQKKTYVVWADRGGIKSASDLKGDGFAVKFQGFPDTRGLFRTDLLAAPTLDHMVSTAEGRERAMRCFENFARAHTPEVMGKILGWAVSCFYAPLFHHVHNKFPMLHVYGPAGNGKTETVQGALRMFYHREDQAETTPNSSIFAIQQLVNGSASIPLLLDEYKPGTMQSDKLNQLRGVLRDVYNAKEVQRGGGSKTVKDNFNALSTIKLQAPVTFIAEAPETETAIVERSVMVSFKRLSGRQQVDCHSHALEFYKDMEPLASLGLEIANRIVVTNNAQESLALFDKSLAWANHKFLPAADDWDKVNAGKMTLDEMRSRAIMRPRSVFNCAVSFFGLQVMKGIMLEKFGEASYKARFEKLFNEMASSVFLGMDTLAQASLPEFIKVLTVFSDMTKLPTTDDFALTDGLDYNLGEMGGLPVLVLAAAQCYRKYRAYMRHMGSQPLYASEESFQLALREIPQFLKMGTGTQRLNAPTLIFNMEELLRASVTPWNGKTVNLGSDKT